MRLAAAVIVYQLFCQINSRLEFFWNIQLVMKLRLRFLHFFLKTLPITADVTR